MYKKLAILFGVVAFAVLLLGAVIAYDWIRDRAETPDVEHSGTVTVQWGHTQGDVPDFQIPSEITPENPAPDFTMYDAYGNEVRLSDFFGKPIILNFWATWCRFCVQEMPYFEQLYTEAGDNIHVIKVNLLDGQRETRERVDNFMADNGHTFPLFFDTGAGAIEYSVVSVPMTFFIDANGSLVSSVRGAVNANTLQNGLDEIMP